MKSIANIINKAGYKPKPLGEAVEVEKRVEAQRQAQRQAMIPKPKLCQHCGDVIWPTPVNNEVYTLYIFEKCDCPGAIEAQLKAEQAERQDKINKHQQWLQLSRSWKSFDTEWPQSEEARQQLRTAKDKIWQWYSQQAGDGLPRGDGLLLVGPVGTGKSHLLRAVIGAYRQQGKRVKTISEPDIVQKVKNNPDALDALVRECQRVELLNIDDLARRNFNAHSEWIKQGLQDFYFQVLDLRASRQRVTLFSTNKNSTALQSHLNDANYDRLRQLVGSRDNVIVFNAVPSKRGEGW